MKKNLTVPLSDIEFKGLDLCMRVRGFDKRTDYVRNLLNKDNLEIINNDKLLSLKLKYQEVDNLASILKEKKGDVEND